MVIFGTFKRFINNEDGTRRLVFHKISNEKGDKVGGEYFIDDTMTISKMNLRFNHRYMIKFDELEGKTLKNISKTLKVKKNLNCDIFRRFKSDFHIIGGKYRGKKVSELNQLELSKYCIWLASNSHNEMTIKNSLILLEGIYDKTD